MMCATESITSMTGLLRSPSAAIADPKKTENTTICRISLRAMASMTLVGMVCAMKPCNDNALACTSEVA